MRREEGKGRTLLSALDLGEVAVLRVVWTGMSPLLREEAPELAKRTG